MKKIVLMIFAVAAMLGCNIDDPTSPTPSRGDYISFSNVTTRAGLSDLQADGFGVWACVSNIGVDGTTVGDVVSYLPLLENEKVYIKDGEWTYDNTERWINNSVFHFFAAYPQDVFQQARIENEEYKFTYYSAEISADGSDDTEDILVATNVTNTTVEGYATTVPLTFGHLLSKFNVKIRQDFDADPDFNYYVTKVTVTGVKGNGACVYLPYGQQIGFWWDYENSTQIILEKEYSEPRILRNAGAADPTITLSVWGSGLMLIPQEIAANAVEVVVDYIYDTNVDTDYTDGVAKQAKAVIPVSQWESGKSYSYSMTLSNVTLISIDKPTIEPWGAPQTGGTIIIK